tara:strand:- start:602 stop:895 length:294 start_codon:yes stop_codon:yes gene_type:complete
MRKITAIIKQAWLNGQPKTIDNTTTDGISVWLHGNLIIEKRDGDEVWATLAGWNTPTTKERLNGITGGHFQTIKYEPYFNGDPIQDNEWVKVGKLVY